MSHSIPQKPDGASTQRKAARARVATQPAANKPGLNLERRDQTKTHSHTASVKISSTSETEGKAISSLPGSRLTLRESPSQKCLPPLPEEDDPDPKSMQNSHEPLSDPSAAVCSHKNIGSDGVVGENLGFNRPLAAPACPYTPENKSVGPGSRRSAQTTHSEEASHLLAERRPQARVQQTPRRVREELALRTAEEMLREEEEQRKEEEEKAQRTREEKRRLHQKKEEAERSQRMERETRLQRDESERQERKKRLEEIMKRTRKTDAEQKPMQSSTPLHDNVKPLHSLPFEEVIKLPSPAKGSMKSLTGEGDILPTVAFKERRSVRTLTRLEEIQSHQRSEVI